MADYAPAAAADQREQSTTTPPAPAPAAPAEPPAASGEAQHGAAAAVPALYVGDLHEDATDENLFDAFSKVGTVTSVRLCRDNLTSRSLRYGYVNYLSQTDAVSALERLNHSLILGKPIRVMWSNRDPDARRSGVGNVFVKNLSDSVDNVRLQELFSKFGDIISCKIIRNDDGASRGYGFVQFASQEPADAAIESLNNSHFGDKQLHVASFVKKSERSANTDDSYTNLYMKNLDEDMTEELIKLKFTEFGSVVSVKIMKRDDGSSRGFGFISFKNPDDAKRAKEAMDGLPLGSKNLYVARAQKKEERKQYLQRLHEEKRNEVITKSNGSNVYIKNIHDEVDDNALRARFDEFGNITSAKVMRDDKGISRGFGFVCYSNPEEAKSAISSMRGVMFHGKPLYVALAQRKEARRAILHQHFTQLARIVESTNSMIPTGYPQIYFAHPNAHLPQGPPRHGFMYPPMGLSHEWRPNMFPSPPNLQQMHSPMVPSSPMHHRSNRGRVAGNMVHVPHTVHTINVVAHAQPAKDYMSMPRRQRFSHPKYFSNEVVADGLAVRHGDVAVPSTDNPEISDPQMIQLGNKLYPLVQRQQRELAGKITGMLIHQEKADVVAMLSSPELLHAKVEEFARLLQATKTNKAEDQEALHPGFMLDSASVNAN